MRVGRRKFLFSGAALPALFPLKVQAAWQPGLMPSQKEVWDWQVWMAKLGPKYTGNDAHRTFVEFLAKQLAESGLEIGREHDTFPRWEARRWNLRIAPANDAAFAAAVTSYFPYSGETPADGVTGKLVYAGSAGKFEISDRLKGNIALIDCPTGERPYGEWYKLWGAYPRNLEFPASVRPMTMRGISTLRSRGPGKRHPGSLGGT